jgi:hypothetical protein
MSTGKLYDIQFEYHRDYLHARVTAVKDNAEISISFWKEIAAECKKYGYKKLLVEENIQYDVSESEICEIISVITDLLQDTKCAFYDHQMSHYNTNKLGEILVLNRGLIGKVFDDIEKAKQWLLSPDSVDFADEDKNKNNAESLSELVLLLLVFSFILNMLGSSGSV